MIELAPGLSYWLAPHPAWEPGENWPQHVPSFRFESPDGLVFIDPLAPPHEVPEWILLTSPWHARDTAHITDRHPGVRVWAPPRAHWKGPPLQTTDDLPAGVEALLPDGDPDEALFLLREQRALVTGDLFSGTGGRFHLFSGDGEDAVLAWLPALFDLPIDLVLIAHGDLILEDGAARIREAVAEATSGRK